MARLDPLLPFVLHWECGLPESAAKLGGEQMWRQAAARGYACVAGDKGGPTMCGVTLATYSAYRGRRCSVAELKAMPWAHWLDIMTRRFWRPCRGDMIGDQRVANMLVDWAWHSGAATAVRHLQGLVGVTADGIMGPRTLAAVNGMDGGKLFGLLKADREAFLRRVAAKPGQAKFLTGWLRRVAAVERI